MRKFLAVLATAAVFAFASPALAANPFADVPAGHWAYDAVAQLAADGLVAGYPDGSFKGGKTASRYEMAALVARAVARGDELHASKQDLELIKKLVAEFKDELDAMGAKVDDLDKRVGTIEKNIGAWKISGILVFDAKFVNGDLKDEGQSAWSTDGDSDEWTKNKARLYLRKQIDENSYFDSEYRLGGSGGGTHAGRGDSTDQKWVKFYVSTKLPYDINMKVGRFAFDWEGEAGLYNDEDALFGDWRVDGFLFEKQFANLKASAVIARNANADNANYEMRSGNKTDQYHYALNLMYKNDKFMLGAMGYYQDGDGGNDGYDMTTIGAYAGYTFMPGLELKGVYYWQDYGETPYSGYQTEVLDDSADSWKLILDVKQSVLKFTSLWVEYRQEDNNFSGNNGAGGYVCSYSFVGVYNEPSVMYNRPVNNNTSKYWFVKAEQKWGESKWGSFIRFTRADFDTPGADDATEWGVGITYQYTPAIQFMLAYDSIDYGSGNTHQSTWDGKVRNGDDNVIMFRTTIRF